ncbi:protein bicaudal C homolog 1-like [Varroa jacobsoni]|nr:protein bicaudal C homolog 1-like isoform X3 [Varroa destructor]XP_022648716.1 protein bicaudal C homolog 1-like isoform X3 [Varroa destructor]XP_022648717.1 protein bicaudal C homolog 1-like isoform X3 [Varroa destructor]XP_022648719.1 protein bicaudal C homolog 1-like isoform X3 [Varroa destructor]XP_022648720.1 protein bicaudal C homolog 1-like isoform X3 [Varroa destructor]XP_022706071.1 protein bicaudal C homolog 1-like [Varroa jacobsoni]
MQRRNGRASSHHQLVSYAQNSNVGNSSMMSIMNEDDICQVVTCYETSSPVVPIKETASYSLIPGSPLVLEDHSHQTDYKSHSRKRFDFFIQTTGNQEQVDIAREETTKILRSNAGNENRVTLKMDVSFSDHSFIIGRKGKGVQGAMRATGCQIHFPDSNKNDRCEKSNQVSVSGTPEAVVEARQRIRELLPISFAFEINEEEYRNATFSPVASDGTVSELRPKIRQMIETLQNEYRMTITWLPNVATNRLRGYIPYAMVTVRGGRRNIVRICEGIQQLNALLRPGKPPPNVELGIEVTSQYVQFTYGNNGTKIQAIMDETRTQFSIVAGRSDTSQHIYTVRIVGKVENVYRAWLAFMDLLPVVVLIQIPESNGKSAMFGQRKDSDDSRVPFSTEGEGSTQMKCITDAQRGAFSCALTEDRGLSEEVHLNLRQPKKTLSLSFDELQALQNLGVLSPETLTSAVSAQKPNGDIEILDPGLYHAISLAAGFTTILYPFEISLTVRPSRDSRSWKLEAKGPESRIDLLMDVYRILRNPSCHALESLRNAVFSETKRPLNFSHEGTLNSLVTTSSSLNPFELSRLLLPQANSSNGIEETNHVPQKGDAYDSIHKSRSYAPLTTGHALTSLHCEPSWYLGQYGPHSSSMSYSSTPVHFRQRSAIPNWPYEQQDKGSQAAIGSYGFYMNGSHAYNNKSKLEYGEVKNATQSFTNLTNFSYTNVASRVGSGA